MYQSNWIHGKALNFEWHHQNFDTLTHMKVGNKLGFEPSGYIQVYISVEANCLKFLQIQPFIACIFVGSNAISLSKSKFQQISLFFL